MEYAEEGFVQAAQRIDNARKGDEFLSVKFSMRLGKIKEPILDANGEPMPMTNREGEPLVGPDGQQQVKTKSRSGNVEYVEIKVPGDSTLTVCEPVRDSHRQRFAKQYQQWKAGRVEQPGTPIAAIFPDNPALVADFQAKGVLTVEQLANVSDGNMQRVGPISAMRQKARDFVASSKRADTVDQLEKLRQDNEALKAQMASLMAARVAPADERAGAYDPQPAAEQCEPVAKRGPGRPRKTTEA